MIYFVYACSERFSPQMIYSFIFSSKAQFLEFLNCSNSATSRSSISCSNKVVDLQCPLSIPITDSCSHQQASNYFTPKLSSALSVQLHLASMHAGTNWASNFNSLASATSRVFWRFQHLCMPSHAVIQSARNLTSVGQYQECR